MMTKDRRFFLLSKVLFFRRNKFGEKGFTIVEVLVASLIICVAALGLGSAISHLSQSRQKTQIISQGVGIEASLVAALQDAGTYSTSHNSPLLGDIKNNLNPSVQPTVNVTLDSSPTHTRSFSIDANPNAPVYLDLDNNQVTSTGNWTNKVTLSNLIHDGTTKSYSYAYNIQANPTLGNIAEIGSSNVSAPVEKDFSVSIPTQAVITADQTKAYCDPANNIGIMGIDSGGNPICVLRAQNKCGLGSISKGYYLQQRSTGPASYSYELMCEGLRTLTCPAQLIDGGVPDMTLYSPYSLQSFLPNSLDRSGASPGTGTCVFVAAHDTAARILPALTDGDKVTGACPPHYVVSNVHCNAGVNNTQPPTVTCASSVPAVPVAPGGVSLTYPTAGTILCQRYETQVCCGDDHTNCAQVWTGQVTLDYTCSLNATTQETINAISN